MQKKPQPALYLGGADGKLHYSPELLIDNRDNKGMCLEWQLLIADYNNDKVLDIYIADQWSGKTWKDYGYRDSYYLSQPNGTWLESSNTHLSDNNFKAFPMVVLRVILTMMAIWILLTTAMSEWVLVFNE